MHHPLIRLAAAACAAVVLCSCTAGGAARITKDTVEYETDTARIYAEKLSFSGTDDEELQNNLNDTYSTDTDSRLIEFENEAAAADMSELVGGNKCVFELKRNAVYNKNSFLSILEEEYAYTGGAHGRTVRRADNIDMLTGEHITLDMLFADDGWENTLNRLINDAVNADTEQYADLWEQPKIKDSNLTDFYITDTGIVIFYQPYDLSYYARGFVEFELSFEDLNGYLKEDYRRLAGERRTSVIQGKQQERQIVV